jgi:hypothetical protein
MTDVAKTGFVGLVTNVSPEVSPVGALDLAENVVIRSPGQIEPRPGINNVTLGWTPATSTPMKIWEYDGKTYVWATDGVFRYDSSTERRLVKTDNTTIDPILFRGDLLTVAQARDNCYVATQTGVLKFTDASDTAFREVGSPTSFCLISAAVSAAGTPRALATGYKFAYRIVIKRKDANGLITRSVPSGAVSVSNTSGATRDVLVQAALTDDIGGTIAFTSGDEIEFYRTKATLNASTFDEEYSFVGVSVPTAGSSGYVDTFNDTVLDSERGARLYTSPSQGGATAENQRPPACGCVESYRGHLFFCNTVGPFRKLVSCNVTTTDLTGVSSGIGYRSAATGSVALGAAVITGLGSTTGLEAGMVIWMWNAGAAATTFPSNTYIISVDSGSQVTVSANALYATGPVTCYFMDAVQVGGAWKPVLVVGSTGGAATVWPTPLFELGVNGIGVSLATTGSTSYTARLITPVTPPYSTTVLIEEIARSASTATATIKATHGSAYRPALDAYAASGTSMDRDVFNNGLAWSKLDEPEHVPPINFARVGDKGKNVLGLAATRDSLFIIKEDGIWRLTGPGGNAVNTWRIDPFDLTTFCVLPQSIVKLNNRVYFLSQKGLVRLSDSGVEIVSNPINDQVKRLVYRSMDYKNTNGYYSLGDSPYWGAAANEIESEYVLAVGDVTGERFAGMLVYNEITNAWTTWTMPSGSTSAYRADSKSPSAIGWSSCFRSLMFGTSNTYGWLRQSSDPTTLWLTDFVTRNDGTAVVTITSVTGSAPTWSLVYTPAYQLVAGDVIVDPDSKVFLVVTAPTSTTATVSRINADGLTPLDGAGATATGVVRCSLRTRPFTQPSTRQKLWTSISAGFSEIIGAASVKITALASSNSNATDAAATTSEPAPGVGYSAGTIYAARGNLYTSNVPRVAARSWRMSPGVEVNMTSGNFKLDLISAEMRDTETGKTANTSTT